MLISLIEENKTTDMQSDPEDESPVIQFSVTPPQGSNVTCMPFVKFKFINIINIDRECRTNFYE